MEYDDSELRMPVGVEMRWLEDRAAIEDKDGALTHEMKHAVPGLYVGPATARMDVEELGVRLVISLLTKEERLAPSYRPRVMPTLNAYRVGDEPPAMAVREMALEFPDDDTAEVSLAGLRRVTHIMHEALTHGWRVLVHCREGISRSPFLVCAYYIAAGHASTMRDALTLLRKDRACAQPLDYFRRLLAKYETELYLRGI